MPTYREATSGQTVTPEDALVPWFEEQARWVRVEDAPTKTTTKTTAKTDDKATDEKPKTTRRRTTKPKTTTED